MEWIVKGEMVTEMEWTSGSEGCKKEDIVESKMKGDDDAPGRLTLKLTDSVCNCRPSVVWPRFQLFKVRAWSHPDMICEQHSGSDVIWKEMYSQICRDAGMQRIELPCCSEKREQNR